MDWIIPLLMIEQVPRSQRAAVAEQLLPAALPGSSSQRLAIAAITAEQQIKRQTGIERNMISEAVKAAAIPTADELAKRCPEIHRAFTRLPPELQANIFEPSGLEGGSPKPAHKPRLAHPPGSRNEGRAS
jgi:hypothetical protein